MNILVLNKEHKNKIKFKFKEQNIKKEILIRI